jgi:8-oxo-dGTP pyrophosphatase MutT (NUDIX family)
MSTEREESFGGVVVHDGNVLVITPTGRPQIATLPKGGPQEGEPPEATAQREVREETGVEARIVERLGDVRYRYRRRGVRVDKTVGFYLCEYVAGDTADHDHEVDDARWMPIEQARTELTYPGEREMIERALSKHSGAM